MCLSYKVPIKNVSYYNSEIYLLTSAEMSNFHILLKRKTKG